MTDAQTIRDDTMSLLDWRRRIADLYAAARAEPDPERAWRRWRDGRGALFANHPQAPVQPPRRAMPRYFDFDPRMRMIGRVVAAEPVDVALPGSADETHPARRFGQVEFDLAGYACRLDVFWLSGYAGGLFLPFRDSSSGEETYGAGRYLLDTAKGADLGGTGDGLVLDFNYAYQPSCSYDPRWSCPLAPPGSTLPLAVRAGERL